jgi:NADH-quinone oxidoreductase subunit J
MSITQILFWVLSVLALFSALMVVSSKNPVFSVVWLIVTFFAISGHYVLLNAQFLAIVNIIVYAGAIMVLFLFVIMLMNLSKDTEPQKNKWLKLAGALAGGCLLLVMVAALRNTEQNMTELATGNIGLIQNLGKVLFSDYVVPFEISSVLFLSAMVGAVVLGKRERDDELQDVEIVSSHPHDEQKVLEKIGE